jgi:hypothetical protein
MRSNPYETKRYSMMIESLTELAEEQRADRTTLAEGLPSLSSVLADAAPLPSEALFLGMADDGLPVLLNLYDPVPGPVFITGDRGSGKTKLLQMIARAAEMLHTPAEVQYGVVTQHPAEWNGFQNTQHNAGIWLTQTENTRELLQSLVNWAHDNKGNGQFFLLLIDDLEALTKLDEQTKQNLRWLLLRGSSRRVWTLVTLNASRARDLGAWLDFFRTRLFGYIEEKEDAESVAGDSNKAFNLLLKGAEFAMPEGKGWLNFWMPVIE